MTHTHTSAQTFVGMNSPRYRGGRENPIRLTTHYLRGGDEQFAYAYRSPAMTAAPAHSTQHARVQGPVVVMSEKDVAIKLNCGHSTLRSMRKNGQGPKHFTMGRRVKYTSVAVEGWLTSQGSK